MLKLVNIQKDYHAGDTIVHALKGVSLTFRDSEFVSILGPSGCGKPRCSISSAGWIITAEAIF